MKALQLPSIAQQAVPDKPRREAKQRGISAKRKKMVSTTQQTCCLCLVCLLFDVLLFPVRRCGVAVFICTVRLSCLWHDLVSVNAPEPKRLLLSLGTMNALPALLHCHANCQGHLPGTQPHVAGQFNNSFAVPQFTNDSGHSPAGGC